MTRSTYLLVDIGGTYCRFAIAGNIGTGIVHHQVLDVAHFPNFEDALEHYLDFNSIRSDTLQAACIAVAAPTSCDPIRLTNSPWVITRAALLKRYRFEQLLLINDFEALAWALKSVKSLKREPVLIPQCIADTSLDNLVVVGPGTGLGVAALLRGQGGAVKNGSIVCASEAGHAGFSPVDEIDIELLRYCRKRYARVSFERVLSGAGLALLHEFFVSVNGGKAQVITPAEVVQAAEEGSDPIAMQAVIRFLDTLGSFAGDMALNFSAFGGVYLGGGIVPRLGRFLLRSNFRARFGEKGRLSDTLHTTPVSLITDEHAALRGALTCLASHARLGQGGGVTANAIEVECPNEYSLDPYWCGVEQSGSSSGS